MSSAAIQAHRLPVSNSQSPTAPAATASAPNNLPCVRVSPRPAYCDSSAACTQTSTAKPATATRRRASASGPSDNPPWKGPVRDRASVVMPLARRVGGRGSARTFGRRHARDHRRSIAPDAADGGCDGARVISSVLRDAYVEVRSLVLLQPRSTQRDLPADEAGAGTPALGVERTIIGERLVEAVTECTGRPLQRLHLGPRRETPNRPQQTVGAKRAHISTDAGAEPEGARQVQSDKRVEDRVFVFGQ